MRIKTSKKKKKHKKHKTTWPNKKDSIFCAHKTSKKKKRFTSCDFCDICVNKGV